jgi:outer membrane biosynthesis protein TonB
LRSEEYAGLALAVAAHVALFVWLALNPATPKPFPTPERMTVTFSNQIADKSTSPEPNADAAPAVAPVLAENPVPEPAPSVAPQPRPAPQPVVRVEPSPLPRPVPKAAPAPQPKPQPKPVPAPAPPVKAQPSKAQPTKTPPREAAHPAGGGSRIGSDFLKGVAGGQSSGKSTNPPAQVAGPAVQSALAGAISRQLKPKWVAPQGAEADQLVTVLAWDLNRDGSLAGTPRVVRQDGITDANRPQARRHAEQAIRAVELAAPFDLPDEYYDAWKRVGSFRFDRKLSQ